MRSAGSLVVERPTPPFADRACELVLQCNVREWPRTASIASVEQGPRHVGFTPDSGHVAATQRNDAMGPEADTALKASRGAGSRGARRVRGRDGDPTTCSALRWHDAQIVATSPLHFSRCS